MKDLIIQTFRRDIDLIQQRHALLFPIDQKNYISAKKNGSFYELSFLDGYKLASVITLEIQFAFKLLLQKVNYS